MRYHEAANYLLDLRRYRPKPGTASTADLLSFLDDPHEGPAYVQIAGSNGKGSTARMVEAVCREAGLTVGLYTSPHFDDLRERLRIDDYPIPKSAVVEFVEAIQPRINERAANGNAPTFFEVITAMGLWYFGREGVDVAVLEVGIGGRYDATSVVDPVASAVTSITLEHTSVLGETIEEIARDKAHVAPTTAPLVTATTGDALDAVRAQTEDLVTVGENGAGTDVTVEYGGVTDRREAGVSLTGPDWALDTTVPLLGAFQARNAGVAAVLARQVADVHEATIARGLRKAHWPGRFEVIDTDPLVILDGAHNPGACDALADTLAEFDYDALHLVLGAMHDKDHAGMAAVLPTPEFAYTCRPDSDRSGDPDVLATVLSNAGARDVTSTSAVETAVGRALDAADADDCVLVTGSLFTIAEARRQWTRTTIPIDVESVADARDALRRADVSQPGVWRMRGKQVHEVVHTTVQRRQAQYLKEELLSLGGECAISGLNDQPRAHLDVVLSGTLAQFKRLVEKLHGQPYGLSEVADQLRRDLGIQYSPPRHGYPWEGDHTAVMGILNVTPDSFHDGGQFDTLETATAQARQLIAAGADIVDVGGESTRPGADEVPVETEIERVVPVVDALADDDVLVSIDTRKAAVGRAALDAGADILNDVTGLEDPEMRFLAAEYEVPLVVMHSIDAPVVPGAAVQYDDVVHDVIASLQERVLLAQKAGVPREKIIVDPGLGFGKTSAESFELLGRLGEFSGLGCPVLVGHSHKSMFDAVGVADRDRTAGTVAGTALAARQGADIVRVHDVQENVDAVRTVEATSRGPDDPSA
jgi:dihydropteroate synthase